MYGHKSPRGGEFTVRFSCVCFDIFRFVTALCTERSIGTFCRHVYPVL